ncbi:septum formation inhibitor-activating ATPase [Sphingopyxis terrae]|uniref:septum formation inhibitor-activating ATPase n=1 Tax=Sphingopyxis terrae TaxID=33052 RepID=UPI002A17227C|nr:septum formation inhibitor-activating ATPase [Sphingopyxis terrae]MDX8357749.1 septum formation inhibitor-activating ATPase [Sphingopyxis terrae]
MPVLEDLIQAAAEANEPSLVIASDVQPGGVDPLGLRQINFNLMDKVLPGLNNVAEMLRPFVLMTWAWRRVRVIIERDKLGGATDEDMRNFVDRIEAIYAWSQFLNDPSARLPGGQALQGLLYGAEDSYHFGGTEWTSRRDLRRTSTGLISPLNYGPGLRMMGWLVPAGPPGVFQPCSDLDTTLDEFENGFSDILEHPVFNKLGPVTVGRDEARQWGELWALSDLTSAERTAGFERLAGQHADKFRREGLELIQFAAQQVAGADDIDDRVAAIRELMAAPAEAWLPAPELADRARAWRRVQVRQLFRLALEATFSWTLQQLVDGPQTTEMLADRFVADNDILKFERAGEWLGEEVANNPVPLLYELAGTLALRDWQNAPPAIAKALRFCLFSASFDGLDPAEPRERLSLCRAVEEFDGWSECSPAQLMSKILEIWVIAQHTYWCVGRGLADARGNGKTLLRLRIVMDEGGWTLTPGTVVGAPPVATPDRLRTAYSLLQECGHL